MDDDDITKKFPILLEGILQDVYSQRAASAWQGAQPQKLTVSMLLPGTSSAAEWRDLLQSRRQFWPTLTTRHARLSTNFPNSLPPHLYPQPSAIPTLKARLVIVAGPALSVSPHFLLSITPIFLFIWPPSPQAHDTACYCCKSHPSTCFPPHSPNVIPTSPIPIIPARLVIEGSTSLSAWSLSFI